MSWVRERRVPWCRERVAMLKKRARRMRNVRRKRVRVKRARVTSRWVWSWAGRRELNGAGLSVVVGRPILTQDRVRKEVKADGGRCGRRAA